jgi:hypothetical protein
MAWSSLSSITPRFRHSSPVAENTLMRHIDDLEVATPLQNKDQSIDPN